MLKLVSEKVYQLLDNVVLLEEYTYPDNVPFVKRCDFKLYGLSGDVLCLVSEPDKAKNMRFRFLVRSMFNHGDKTLKEALMTIVDSDDTMLIVEEDELRDRMKMLEIFRDPNLSEEQAFAKLYRLFGDPAFDYFDVEFEDDYDNDEFEDEE